MKTLDDFKKILYWLLFDWIEIILMRLIELYFNLEKLVVLFSRYETITESIGIFFFINAE